MSDAEWDADDFEVKKPVASDKWLGEDEEEEVRDNWDDDDETDRKDETISESTAVQVKKKKPLKERIAERELKHLRDLEEKQKQEEEEKKHMTPKQLFEEKLRRQKLQEEADLALAVEAFGFGKEEVVVGVIDGFEPKTKEDFDRFSHMLSEKISKFEKSPFYMPFMETLVRDVTLAVGPDDLKKLSNTLTALYNDKVKQLKSTKGKKKTNKATLIVEKDNQAGKEDGRFNEFDDYL